MRSVTSIFFIVLTIFLFDTFSYGFLVGGQNEPPDTLEVTESEDESSTSGKLDIGDSEGESIENQTATGTLEGENESISDANQLTGDPVSNTSITLDYITPNLTDSELEEGNFTDLDYNITLEDTSVEQLTAGNVTESTGDVTIPDDLVENLTNELTNSLVPVQAIDNAIVSNVEGITIPENNSESPEVAQELTNNLIVNSVTPEVVEIPTTVQDGVAVGNDEVNNNAAVSLPVENNADVISNTEQLAPEVTIVSPDQEVSIGNTEEPSIAGNPSASAAGSVTNGPEVSIPPANAEVESIVSTAEEIAAGQTIPAILPTVNEVQSDIETAPNTNSDDVISNGETITTGSDFGAPDTDSNSETTDSTEGRRGTVQELVGGAVQDQNIEATTVISDVITDEAVVVTDASVLEQNEETIAPLNPPDVVGSNINSILETDPAIELDNTENSTIESSAANSELAPVLGVDEENIDSNGSSGDMITETNELNGAGLSQTSVIQVSVAPDSPTNIEATTAEISEAEDGPSRLQDKVSDAEASESPSNFDPADTIAEVVASAAEDLDNSTVAATEGIESIDMQPDVISDQNVADAEVNETGVDAGDSVPSNFDTSLGDQTTNTESSNSALNGGLLIGDTAAGTEQLEGSSGLSGLTITDDQESVSDANDSSAQDISGVLTNIENSVLGGLETTEELASNVGNEGGGTVENSGQPGTVDEVASAGNEVEVENVLDTVIDNSIDQNLESNLGNLAGNADESLTEQTGSENGGDVIGSALETPDEIDDSTASNSTNGISSVIDDILRNSDIIESMIEVAPDTGIDEQVSNATEQIDDVMATNDESALTSNTNSAVPEEDSNGNLFGNEVGGLENSQNIVESPGVAGENTISENLEVTGDTVSNDIEESGLANSLPGAGAGDNIEIADAIEEVEPGTGGGIIGNSGTDDVNDNLLGSGDSGTSNLVEETINDGAESIGGSVSDASGGIQAVADASEVPNAVEEVVSETEADGPDGGGIRNSGTDDAVDNALGSGISGISDVMEETINEGTENAGGSISDAASGIEAVADGSEVSNAVEEVVSGGIQGTVEEVASETEAAGIGGGGIRNSGADNVVDNALGSGISDVVETINDGAESIGGSVSDAASGIEAVADVSEVVSGGDNIVSEMGGSALGNSGLGSAVEEVVSGDGTGVGDQISGVVDSVVEGASGVIDSVADGGSNVVGGLKNGIEDVLDNAENITGKVRGAVGGIINEVGGLKGVIEPFGADTDEDDTSDSDTESKEGTLGKVVDNTVVYIHRSGQYRPLYSSHVL